MSAEHRTFERVVPYGLAFVAGTALVFAASARTDRIDPSAPHLRIREHPLPPGSRTGAVETIEHGGTVDDVGVQTIHVHVGETLIARGWAVDPRTGFPPEHVLARVDGGAPEAGDVARWRPDVAAALGDPVGSQSGYRVAVPAVPPGAHRLRISFSSGGRAVGIEPVVEFDVER